MEMKYVKPLVNSSEITRYEEQFAVRFPPSYKSFVKQYNGGRPSLKCFKTENDAERVIKSFLSFNLQDRETIWKITEWNAAELQNQYVPFAIDPAGNLICFKRGDNSVAFIDLETLNTEKAAASFEQFLSELY